MIIAKMSSGGGSPLTVEEVDGVPSVSNVDTIVVSNGTLTDDGGGQVTITTGGGSSLPVVDETAIVYKTGNVAITQTHNIDAYSTARVIAWPDAAGTVPLLEVAQTFTAGQKINVNSTAALFVEQDGVNDNVLVINTTSRLIGIGTDAPQSHVHCHQPAAGATNYFTFTNAVTTAGLNKGTFYGIDSSGNCYLWNWQNTAFFFATNGAARMRINSDGGIAMGGNFVPTAQLHIDQSSATGAKPVLLLDQADVDQPTVKIVGTSDSGTTTQTLIKASDFATPGSIIAWEMITVTDTRVGGIGTNQVGYRPIYAAPT